MFEHCLTLCAMQNCGNAKNIPGDVFFLLFNNVSGYKAPRRRSASRYTEKTMVLLLPCYRASLERALKPKYVRNYAQRAVLLAALNNAGATFTFSLQNTQTHAVIVSPSFLHKLDLYGVRIMALSIKFVTVRVKFTQYKVLAFILFTFIVSHYKHCLRAWGFGTSLSWILSVYVRGKILTLLPLLNILQLRCYCVKFQITAAKLLR